MPGFSINLLSRFQSNSANQKRWFFFSVMWLCTTFFSKTFFHKSTTRRVMIIFFCYFLVLIISLVFFWLRYSFFWLTGVAECNDKVKKCDNFLTTFNACSQKSWNKCSQRYFEWCLMVLRWCVQLCQSEILDTQYHLFFV